MKKNYYVEITVSGCICVEAESADDAIFLAEEAVKSNNDAVILEDIGNMLRRHLDSGDVDVGDAFEDDCNEEAEESDNN